VHGLAEGTLNPLDSERRPGRSDLRVMRERWKNHQRLNVSTKTGRNLASISGFQSLFRYQSSDAIFGSTRCADSTSWKVPLDVLSCNRYRTESFHQSGSQYAIKVTGSSKSPWRESSFRLITLNFHWRADLTVTLSSAGDSDLPTPTFFIRPSASAVIESIISPAAPVLLTLVLKY
jgi:hypothetical protein